MHRALFALSLTATTPAWAQEAPPDAPADAPATAADRREARRAAPLPPGREEGFHLDLLVGTAFPVDAGARVMLEMPHRIRTEIDVGFMPGPYQDAIQAALVGAGAYDEDTSQVIADSLRSAFSLYAGVGWRPLPREGFFFDLGYRYVALGGSSTAEDALIAGSGQEPPASLPDSEDPAWRVRSQLHQFGLHLGWEFVPVRNLSIRIRLGTAITASARSRITPGFDASRIDPEEIREFTSPSEAWLQDQLRRYGHVPVIGLDLGYRWM